MSNSVFACQGCFNYSLEVLRLRESLKEYQDQIVKKEHDNFNLLCKLQEHKEKIQKILRTAPDTPFLSCSTRELLEGLINGV